MVNPGKVRALSRKALFEQNEGWETLKIKEYCEDLPVWKGLTRSAIAGVLLYILLLALALLFGSDWFVSLREQIGDFWLTVLAAVSMAVFAAGYCVISDILFRRVYRKIRSSLCGYHVNAALLEKELREQEHHETVD